VLHGRSASFLKQLRLLRIARQDDAGAVTDRVHEVVPRHPLAKIQLLMRFPISRRGRPSHGRTQVLTEFGDNTGQTGLGDLRCSGLPLVGGGGGVATELHVSRL
jgi:hypothetical protein